jgi:hypothetical protein
MEPELERDGVGAFGMASYKAINSGRNVQALKVSVRLRRALTRSHRFCRPAVQVDQRPMQIPVLRQHHKHRQIRHILQGSRFEVRRFSISAPSLTLTSPQAEPPFVQKLRSDPDTVREYRPP